MSFNPEVLKVDWIITKKEEKFLNKLKNKLNNDINYFSNIEKSTLQQFVANLKSELSKLKGKYKDKEPLINQVISWLEKIVWNDLKLYKVNNVQNDEGYVYKKCIGSYIHLHFGSNQNLFKDFLGGR